MIKRKSIKKDFLDTSYVDYKCDKCKNKTRKKFSMHFIKNKLTPSKIVDNCKNRKNTQLCVFKKEYYKK